METRDIISTAALLISAIALLVALGSAFFTAKQFQLNEARDVRERAARLPTFEHALVAQREGRLWKATITIVNRSDVKLMFDFAAIETPEGARLANPDGAGSHLNPVGALNKFIEEGITPSGSGTWSGFIVIDDQSPGGRGKQAKLIYAFRFLDAPTVQIEKEFYVILPATGQ